MKKNCFLYLLLIMAVGLGAETLSQWQFLNAKVPGLVYPENNVAFQISPERTPDGASSGEFKIKKNSQIGYPLGIQINFVSNQKLVAGSMYRYSFYAKASQNADLDVSCMQELKPWTLLNISKKIPLNTQWQKISIEFSVAMDYEGLVRTPCLMVGRFPEGSTLWVGPVTFEKCPQVLPLALNTKWKLFFVPQETFPDLASIQAIPETLVGSVGREVTLTDNTIDLPSIDPKQFESGTSVAIIFNELTSPADGVMQIGCAADWMFRFRANGVSVYDTLSVGNGVQSYLTSDHIFQFPVKKGKNLIAVEVFRGSLGWKFVCGTVSQEELERSQLVTIQPGPQWRPVKMDDLNWKGVEIHRLPMLELVKGSALDLSRYIEAYDIDRYGRLKSNAAGQLYFENMPEKMVRLRGFSFIADRWESGFYRMTPKELEELAEQIRLAGMNVLRFHMLDAALAGLAGLPRDAKDITETGIPRSVEELKIDPNFADRFDYFIKCLRDRGIYILPDVFTNPGLMTGANQGKDNPRFQMFDNPAYRDHWRTALNYILYHRNAYTGKKLIDDPQLIGFTCYNEQEHIFTINSPEIKRFTPEWRKIRNPENPEAAPEFSGDLLLADTPDGDAARIFLRSKIADLNDFYLGTIRETGFPGFVINWDMYYRNLEGDARKEYNAVAGHAYFAHVSIIPAPKKYQIGNVRGRTGGWKDSLLYVGRDSSINVMNNYIGRTAVTRVLGKPFFMTEYSHCGQNRYSQEAGPIWAAYASLQDWQILTPHANTVGLYHRPFSFGFDENSNFNAGMTSLLTCFGWQRGDIQRAPHAVSFHVPKEVLDSPRYVGTIGNGYTALFMLTRIGSNYLQAKNSVATLTVVPEHYGMGWSMGSWVKTFEEYDVALADLRGQVTLLRQNGILPADNRTDVARGLYESETGEILADTENKTFFVDAPRFQSATLKSSTPVALSNLSVQSVSVPCTIAAISLDNNKAIGDSDHLLIVVGTLFRAVNAIFTNDTFESEISTGDLKQVIQSGLFSFSVKTSQSTTPKVYALNLNGSRECEVPVKLENGNLSFTLDTSKLEYGTPYFEVVY